MVAENTVKKPAANPVSSTRKPAHNGHSISLEARRKIARSRITRGCDILPDVDGRSLVARRYREIASAILVDQCQSASKFDPRSASNFDPFGRRVLAVALAPSELVGVAETARVRVDV
jgi:hypothetical protein